MLFYWLWTNFRRPILIGLAVIAAALLLYAAYDNWRYQRDVTRGERIVTAFDAHARREAEARRQRDSTLAFTAGRRLEYHTLYDSLYGHAPLVPVRPLALPAQPPREP
ncbi:hypothetical protein [Hymenobacter siberiensis]|uniref:hypothetical protein n=1 Tax=Hymenobacter siberiensis TaxID=2848396 RepID=UPI001C1E4543|nr:hypothetical protein [Hymenobacter siberiensis]